MTDEELIGLIEEHVTDSLGFGDEISRQREQAMDYYLTQPFGNEVRPQDDGSNRS